MDDPTYLAVENLKSWDRVARFYDNRTGPNYRDEILLLLALARQLVGTPRAERFHAEPFHLQILISTSQERVLEDSEPFVAVGIDHRDDGLLYQIEFWNAFSRSMGDVTFCPESCVLYHLDRYLEKLWSETRGRPVS